MDPCTRNESSSRKVKNIPFMIRENNTAIRLISLSMLQILIAMKMPRPLHDSPGKTIENYLKILYEAKSFCSKIGITHC